MRRYIRTERRAWHFVYYKRTLRHYDDYKNNAHIVTLGEVPIVISNAGVYFRELFTGGDYFNRIKSEHAFQELTESNKPSKAFRKRNIPHPCYERGK